MDKPKSGDETKFRLITDFPEEVPDLHRILRKNWYVLQAYLILGTRFTRLPSNIV